MPEDTIYFTIVREPSELFQSLFAFVNIGVLPLPSLFSLGIDGYDIMVIRFIQIDL